MPFTGPISYPDVNGVRYDFTSISFLANGQPIIGVTEIDYGNELKPTEVYGTLAQMIGAGRGQLKANASFSIFELEYQALITQLCILNGTPGSGFMEVRWDIQVQKQDGLGVNPGPLITDVIRGFKIVKPAASFKVGDVLLRKVEGHCFWVEENGQLPIGINPALATKFING